MQGLPEPCRVNWDGTAAPGNGALPRRFALDDGARKALLQRLICTPRSLTQTVDDVLAEGWQHCPGTELAMLWCVFHKNPHGIRSVCTKGRKVAWARGQLVADLLLELGAEPVEYASHKTSAEQWLFVRRCWGRAAPHARQGLRKLFEETTRAVHRKTVAAQARRVADALRLSQLLAGDQLSLRLVPRGAQPVQDISLFLDRAAIDRGRVRLWLRLYRCAGAEHALNWVRDDAGSGLIEATRADGRDAAALAGVAGVSPASYVRVVLARRGGSLCGLRTQWPGYCEADWRGLDSGRERWYTHELAPWCIERLRWPACVATVVGQYLGPVHF
eukprot:g69089.t1